VISVSIYSLQSISLPFNVLRSFLCYSVISLHLSAFCWIIYSYRSIRILLFDRFWISSSLPSVWVYSLQIPNLFSFHLTFCVHSNAIYLTHFIWVPSVELFTVTDLIEFVFSIGFGTRLRHQCEYSLQFNLFSFHLTFCVHSYAIYLSHCIWVLSVELFSVTVLIRSNSSIDRVIEQEQSTIVYILFCHPTHLSLNLISCWRFWLPSISFIDQNCSNILTM
jgi:hypothetical protein